MTTSPDTRLQIAEVLPFGVHAHSGVLGAVVGLSVALARRGHQVELWELGPDLPENRAAELTEAGVERVAINLSRPPWSLGSAAARTIRARPAHIVHLHNVFSPANNLIARSISVPFVLSPHGGYAPGGFRRSRVRKAVFKRVLELPMLRRAALVSALTPAEAEDVRRYGFEGPVRVVPQGMTPAKRGADGQGFRASLGLGVQPLALFVGRLDISHKRLDSMVRAVAATPGWHLALVGPDWRGGRARLMNLAAELNAEVRIHLPGPLHGDRLHAAIAAADVFLLMSRSEGQSLALLEALARGVPALVSPEVGRVIDVHGAGAGHVVSPEAVPDALNRLAASSPSAVEKLRSGARQLGSSFSWSRTAVALERALFDVTHASGMMSASNGSLVDAHPAVEDA